jgi:hypothetical protein
MLTGLSAFKWKLSAQEIQDLLEKKRVAAGEERRRWDEEKELCVPRPRRHASAPSVAY